MVTNTSPLTVAPEMTDHGAKISAVKFPEQSTDCPTDYELELDRSRSRLEDAELSCQREPTSVGEQSRRLYARYRYASLTGRLADFQAVDDDITRTFELVEPNADLYFLKACVNLKFHRLAEVKRNLALAPVLVNQSSGRILQAEVDFQEGKYDQARDGFEAAVEQNRSWDHLARLAYFKWKMGDENTAELLYLEAIEEITAKEPRSFAWIELQRGLVDLSRGRRDHARQHYCRAAAVYSGYWLVDEHRAEWLGSEGRYDEAIKLYRRVVAWTDKPESKQAIGELLCLQENPAQAEHWLAESKRQYLISARVGEVHYYHHLSDYYSDAERNAGEAIYWASRDRELRPYFATQAALAWALYRDGQFSEAANLVTQVLASGVVDARLFAKAAKIYAAVDRAGEASQLKQRALELNPELDRFHVHH